MGLYEKCNEIVKQEKMITLTKEEIEEIIIAIKDYVDFSVEELKEMGVSYLAKLYRDTILDSLF